jgi:hypothetical protein
MPDSVDFEISSVKAGIIRLRELRRDKSIPATVRIQQTRLTAAAAESVEALAARYLLESGRVLE